MSGRPGAGNHRPVSMLGAIVAGVVFLALLYALVFLPVVVFTQGGVQ